jgi:hypothetical protein
LRQRHDTRIRVFAPTFDARRYCFRAARHASAGRSRGDPVHGTWVRDEGACSTGPLLTIEAERLRFANGGHSQRYTKLVVEPSPGGRAKRGTFEVLADLPDGSPFLLFLTPGSPPLVNLNWRALEDQLARRFPLAPSALKRCPG